MRSATGDVKMLTRKIEAVKSPIEQLQHLYRLKSDHTI